MASAHGGNGGRHHLPDEAYPNGMGFGFGTLLTLGVFLSLFNHGTVSACVYNLTLRFVAGTALIAWVLLGIDVSSVWFPVLGIAAAAMQLWAWYAAVHLYSFTNVYGDRYPARHIFFLVTLGGVSATFSLFFMKLLG